MHVPADGVPRLMHFVDARLDQLRISKEEASRRGFPNPSTLAKVRDRDTQNTPTVRTLLRIDRTLGWQPGSAAVVLLGGNPLSITARTTKSVRAKEQAAKPMTADEVVTRLLDQLRDEINRTCRDLNELEERMRRLRTIHSRLVGEFMVDGQLLQDFDDAVAEAGA
ncbi:hypothetical protein [Mycobacterium branderi]|uniref:XRE family transcriptional regulator n=1 Tax=Mycobacterium branderi TaxID=43348 RepID=A0A7I7WF93_9MYCO|nr:hypothetical protein [Mycobacterium branderi]MCV7231818.1 hypothetical protein [Mycobacterium branderi]ORA40229.1 hypothetical protein BST20_06620 [Mycobacterium branderi]BBZ15527.1 hypothetical protein MBRA_57220 [Mycobacterium branderi]